MQTTSNESVWTVRVFSELAPPPCLVLVTKCYFICSNKYVILWRTPLQLLLVSFYSIDFRALFFFRLLLMMLLRAGGADDDDDTSDWDAVKRVKWPPLSA
jgi:hypothetical protein